MISPPRLLFIDAYDSFSHNIVALVEALLHANVWVIHIDDERYLTNDGELFRNLLKQFDAVIAGPGPGAPGVDADVGLMKLLWTLHDDDLLPVFGICLGFQSLALAYGARIERLVEPRHGVVAEVRHNGDRLFANCEHLFVTQYNSLTARLSDCAAQDGVFWVPTKSCPALQQLAWICDDHDNGPILQAVKHISKPFWAVQYHPESICTDHGGANVVFNWWTEASNWIMQHKKVTPLKALQTASLSCLVDAEHSSHTSTNNCWSPSDFILMEESSGAKSSATVEWESIALGSMTVESIVESLRIVMGTVVVLESATREDRVPVNAETGRFSILACFLPGETEHLQHYSATKQVLHSVERQKTSGKVHCENIWTYLKKYMQYRKASHGSPNSPFWGGLVGFASYEACLKTVNVKSSTPGKNRPDACFIFVQRSIVIDHASGFVYVQSIRPDDQLWIQKTVSILGRCDQIIRDPTTADQQQQHHLNDMLDHAQVRMPKREEYCRKVRACQEAIRAGDSYELCLTDQTQLLLPSPLSHSASTDWHLYQRLRHHNPAPYGCFLRLECTAAETLSIMSSSPERFLGWSRPTSTSPSRCQYRPIKGTVRKTPSMTRARAESILNSSKERAENLMIVDLIRHDLFGVVGAGNVRVEKLMQVEEYETVFQLVSVIEGQLSEEGGKTGIDVLAASLPPGSMTGAPKKRSCELLQRIEGGRPRGIYSGVLGYFDVGGGGDFSVVIRTASRWSGDVEDGEDGGRDVWTIGAGGAVTSQSTDVGEWEEMETKRDALLDAFCASR